MIEGKEWFILKGSSQNQAYIGQVVRFKEGEFEYLANLIKGKRGKVIFLDGNKLNCRRENLKLTPSPFQTKLPKWTKSQDKGIYWDKSKWRFEIRIPFNQERLSMGYYKTKEEALSVKRMVENVFKSLKEHFNV